MTIKNDFGAYCIIHINENGVFANLERAYLTGNIEEARMKFFNFCEQYPEKERFELRMKAKYSTREKKFIPCDIFIAGSYMNRFKEDVRETKRKAEEASKAKTNEEMIKILFDGVEVGRNENENKD